MTRRETGGAEAVIVNRSTYQTRTQGKTVWEEGNPFVPPFPFPVLFPRIFFVYGQIEMEASPTVSPYFSPKRYNFHLLFLGFFIGIFCLEKFSSRVALKNGRQTQQPFAFPQSAKSKTFLFVQTHPRLSRKSRKLFFRVQEPHPFPSSSSSFFCHRRRDSRFHKTLVEKTI